MLPGAVWRRLGAVPEAGFSCQRGAVHPLPVLLGGVPPEQEHSHYQSSLEYGMSLSRDAVLVKGDTARLGHLA